MECIKIGTKLREMGIENGEWVRQAALMRMLRRVVVAYVPDMTPLSRSCPGARHWCRHPVGHWPEATASWYSRVEADMPETWLLAMRAKNAAIVLEAYLALSGVLPEDVTRVAITFMVLQGANEEK